MVNDVHYWLHFRENVFSTHQGGQPLIITRVLYIICPSYLHQIIYELLLSGIYAYTGILGSEDTKDHSQIQLS